MRHGTANVYGMQPPNSRRQTPLLLALAILVVTILGACQPRDQRSGPRSQATVHPGDIQPAGSSGATRTSGATGQPGASFGTSDPGGGNGVDGKVLESYIKTLPELRGYSKYIEPVLKRWGDKSNGILEMIPHVKTWYVAPMSLKPIDKKVLGISASDDGLQQLALQTEDEVLIDKKLTEKSDDKAFTELVWHEIVMSWYLVKYLDFTEFCKKARAKSGSGCPEEDSVNSKIMTASLKGLPFKPLDAQDYGRIRRVTDWVIRYGAKSKRENLIKILEANNFDRRFFAVDKNENIEPVNYKAVDLLRLLELLPKLGHESNQCVSRDSPAVKNCSTSFEVFETNNKYLRLGVTFIIDGTNITREGYFDTKDENSMSVIGIANTSLFVTCLWTDIVDLKVGDIYSRTCFYFMPLSEWKNEEVDLLQRVEFVGTAMSQQIVTRVTTKQGNISLVTPLGTGSHLRCVDLVAPENAAFERQTLAAVRHTELASNILGSAELTMGLGTSRCQPIRAQKL
jgi:hypothetical protein